MKQLLVGIATTTGVLMTGASAMAGGLLVGGDGPIGMSRAGAYVANAGDPSAVVVNPAGLAKHQGTVIILGANFLSFDLEFWRNGSYDDVADRDLAWEGQRYGLVKDVSKPPIGLGPFQALPIIAISTDLGLKVQGLRFGFGVFAPSVYPTRDLASDYTIDDPSVPPPPSRYDIVEQEAAVVKPAMAVAYAINHKLAVGGRLTWGIGATKAKTYVWGSPENFTEWTGNDAIFKVEGQDNFVPEVGLGALYRPIPSLEIGAQWSSQMNISFVGKGTAVLSEDLRIPLGQMELVPTLEPIPDGETLCADGGSADTYKACVALGLPMSASIGARYIFLDGAGAERGDLELDVHWENQSAVSDFNVTVDAQVNADPVPPQPLKPVVVRHGFKDTVAVRLGGGYQIPMGGHQLILRGGVGYETAAAKDGWERADIDGAARTTVTAGVGLRGRKFEVNVGGGAVLEGYRAVGGNCNPSTASLGCDGSGSEAPVEDRTGADPAAPVLPPDSTFESPVNHGRYKSHYKVLLASVSTWF